MKILVTNDDGIDAEGLDILVAYLKAMNDATDAGHRIVVIAPEGERSGVSHSMTLRHPTKIKKLSEDVYTCSGTPADCIIVAGLGILKWQPDLVISGINRGPNMGTDIIYSGTCGAARQAALAGIPAIAVSCARYNPPLDYRACAAFVANNLDSLTASWREDCFININGPSSSDETLAGKWTVPGRNRYYDHLKCFDGADGYTYCFLAGGKSERDFNPLSDHQAVEEGFMALTLVNIHPEAIHPEEWTGREFNPADGQ
jgi:5'-nucleotidase